MTNSGETVKSLSKKEFREHGKNIIIAAIEGIPYIGGSISSLLSEYLPDWKEKRILAFIEGLSEELNKVKEKINQDYIKSEEFAYLFENTFLKVLSNYQKEKLSAYKAILINSCINTDYSTVEKEYFLSLVDRLDIIHMVILSLFWDPNSFKKNYKVEFPNNISFGSLNQTISTLLKPLNFDKNLWESAIRDLDSMGFLKNVYDSLNTMMTPQGATELKGRMTLHGQKFCRFITLEK